jgi:hypothetical protein
LAGIREEVLSHPPIETEPPPGKKQNDKNLP